MPPEEDRSENAGAEEASDEPTEGSPPAGGEEAAPRSGRRILRKLVLALFLLAACLAAGAYLLRRPLFEGFLRAKAKEILEKEAGLDAHLGAVRGTYVTGFTVDGVFLEGRPHRLPRLRKVTVDRLDVEFDPLGLLLRGLGGVRRVRASGVTVHLDLEAEKAPPPGGSAAAPAPSPGDGGASEASEGTAPPKPFHDIPLPPLLVENANVLVTDEGFRLQGEGVHLIASGTARGPLTGVLSWDTWTLEAGGKTLSCPAAFLAFHKKGSDASLRAVDALTGARTLRADLVLPDRLEGGVLEGTARGEVGTLGAFEIEGKAFLPPGEGFQARGSVEAFDLEALQRIAGALPRSPRGRVSADAVSLKAETWDPATFEGRARIEITEAGLATGEALDRLELDASLERGWKGSVSGNAAWDGGRARWELHGGFGAETDAHLEVSTGDLGPVLPDLAGHPLDAVLTVQGQVAGKPEAPSFSGRIDLRGEKMLGAGPGTLQASGRVDAGSFDIEDLRATLKTSSLTGSCRGRFPVSEGIAFEGALDAKKLEELLPPVLREKAALSGDLRVSGEGSLGGGEREGEIDVVWTGPGYGDLRADRLEFMADAEGRDVGVSTLVLEEGNRRLVLSRVEASVGDRGVRGTIHPLRVEVEGEALQSRDAATFSVEKSAFHLSPLELRGSWGRLRLAGALERGGALSGIVTGDYVLLDRVARLAGLREKLSGALCFLFEVGGTASAPELDGYVRGRGVGCGAFPKTDAEIRRMEYRKGLLTLEACELRSGAGYASLSATVPLPYGAEEEEAGFAETLFTSPALDVQLTFRDLDPSFLPLGGAAPPKGRLEGSVELSGPLTAPGLRAGFSCESLEMKDLRASGIRAEARSVEGGLWIEEVRATLPVGRLDNLSGLIPLRLGLSRDAEGGWAFDPLSGEGSFSLRGRVAGLDVRKALETAKAPERFRSLEGRGEVRLEVEGTWASPRIELEADMEAIRSPRLETPGEIRFTATYEDRLLSLSDFEVDLAEGFVEGEAEMPLRLDRHVLEGGAEAVPADASVSGEIEIRSLRADAVSTYLSGIERTGGRLDGKATLEGAVRDPVLKGDFRIAGGVLVFEDASLPSLDSLVGDIRLDDRDASFTVTGETGGGALEATGEIALDDRRRLERITVDLEGRDRPLLWKGDPLRTRADFDLHFEGGSRKARLEGEVTVFYSEARIRHDLAAPGTGAKPLVPGFSVPPFEAVEMDISLQTPEGIRVFYELHQAGISLVDLDLMLRGNLQLTGKTEEPVLSGNVYTQEGEAELPFYTLKIVTGNVNFLESNPDNPELNFMARTTKGDTNIYVAVSGSLRDNEIRFYSEPPMPEADIQAYLATGVKPEAWRGEKAGETLGIQVATLVAKQLSPYLFGKGGGGEGLLDRLTLSSEKKEAGEAPLYRAEYRLLDWLWLVGERDPFERFSGRLKARVGLKSRRPEEKALDLPAMAEGETAEEKPIPFPVVFEGDTPLSTSAMEAAVQEDFRRYAKFGERESYLQDAAWRLKNLLVRNGYHYADVRVRLEPRDGERTAVCRVDAGPWVELRRVRFVGNTVFDESDLAPFFEAEKVLPIEFEKRPFVRRWVEDGVSDVQALYRNAGYLWAEAKLRAVTWSDENDVARAIVDIEEGKQAIVRGVEVEGADVPEKEILSRIGKPVGKPFSPSMPLTARNVLLDFYANRGHPFARVRVEPSIDRDAAAVSLAVEIEPGNRVRIGEVRPRGNAITRDGVVRFLADFGKGDLYRSDALRRAYADLMRSGLFRAVEIETIAREDDPHTVDLGVNVSEADDFVFTASVGSGEYQVFVTELQIRNRNVLGTGRSAWVAGSLSIGDMPKLFKNAQGRLEEQEEEVSPRDWTVFRSGRLEAVARDPWILGSPVEGTFEAYIEQRTEVSYNVKRGGLDLPFSVDVVEKVRLTLSYAYEFARVFDVEPGVDPGKQDVSVSAVRIMLSRDGRDDRFNPRWGTYLSLSHTFAGRALGGTVDFDRSRLRGYVYLSPAGDLFTLVLGGQGAVIDPKRGTESIPLSLRLFRGGDATVRSFYYDELGPKSASGSPRGGEAYLQFNVEARIPFYKFLGAALFFEGGSLKRNAAWWLHLGRREIPEQDRFRYAAGLGLRANTPIGPLRLDLGVNPWPLPDESPWALHFSVGHPF